jgi:hypothetical protein
MCFVWIWEQTAIISLYIINWLVFITEMECVYCAVRTYFRYSRSLHCWVYEPPTPITRLPLFVNLRPCLILFHVTTPHILTDTHGTEPSTDSTGARLTLPVQHFRWEGHYHGNCQLMLVHLAVSPTHRDSPTLFVVSEEFSIQLCRRGRGPLYYWCSYWTKPRVTLPEIRTLDILPWSHSDVFLDLVWPSAQWLVSCVA